MKITWICAIVVCLDVLRSVPLDAQATSRPDSVQHRNDCRLASQVLTKGQPANKYVWALAHIPTCGPVGGLALAEVLEQNRNIVRPEALEDIVMLASDFHDASIFRAALDVAGDEGSTKQARIQALRVVYYQLGRGRVDPYESFLAAESGAIYHYLPDHGCGVGEPLPTDAAQQALHVAEAAIQSARDADVRAAAQKLSGAARWSVSHGDEC